jgi:aspartokinase
MTQIIITENQSIATFAESPHVCEVLEKAADAGIIIDMIAQVPSASGQAGLGFTFSDKNTAEFLKIVKEQDKSVSCGNVKVTVKSEDMITGTGFASRVFSLLKSLDCSPLLVTTGIDEISLLIHESCRSSLEKSLMEVF